MTSAYWIKWSLVGAFFLLAAVEGATGAPQVVGDEGCEKYVVDVAMLTAAMENFA